jgi:hypothetical protein
VREVLVGSELHRIDEDAGDEAIAVPARGFDEAHMTRVQVSHRRDEGNTQPLAAPGAHVLAHGSYFFDGIHGADGTKSCAAAPQLRCLRPARRQAAAAQIPRLRIGL